MENDLLNSLAMLVPISMGASVCVLFGGRREAYSSDKFTSR